MVVSDQVVGDKMENEEKQGGHLDNDKVGDGHPNFQPRPLVPHFEEHGQTHSLAEEEENGKVPGNIRGRREQGSPKGGDEEKGGQNFGEH